jgi:hypothetical protein
MLNKSRTLAIGLTMAGMIGFGASVASAATMSGHGGIVNVSNNQVPVQACGNDLDINGIGGQVPAEGDAVVGSLLSPGSVTKAKATDNRGCGMINNQSDSSRHSGKGGLVNVANNQVPAQFCGNEGMGNVIGGQVPLTGLAGALAIASPFSITSADATNNQGCGLINNQQNGKQDNDHHGHGTCPCMGGRPAGGSMSAPARQGAM